MFSIVRALIDRFKGWFMSQAVLELQADIIVACADRKADLLRRAERLEEEGLADIAVYLRQQVESLSTERPLATVLAIDEHGQTERSASLQPAPNGPAAPTPIAAVPTYPAASQTLKKSRRS